MIINLSNFGGGGTPSGYTYSKAEIDGKDATTLQSATAYTEEVLEDYYTASETDSAIATAVAGKVSFRVVESLPEEGEASVVYLVPKSDPDMGDGYDEYVWVDGDWEKVGSSQIDLSNYYTKTEVDTQDAATLSSANTYTDEALDDYYTKTDVDSALSGKQDTLTAGENITISGNVISAKGGAKNEPLCIEVVGIQAYVRLAGAGVVPYLDLQYSFDKETWVQYDGGTIVLEDSIEGNKKVYFKGNNPEGFYKYGDNAIFVISGSNVKLSGNIMSLISEDATEIPVNSCFARLFYDGSGRNATIVNASELLLPATVLKPYCYEYMFYGQYNMQYPPELPATELEDGCYHQMFCECWGLLKFPSLMAHEIPQYAYKQMFASSHSYHRDTFVILADNIHIDGATDMFMNNNDISTVFISPNCPLDLITQFDSRSRLVNYLTEEEQIIAINNLEASKATTGYVDTKDAATLQSAKNYTDNSLDGYYTKTEVNSELALKANASDVYTKTEVDSALGGKQDTLTAGENITIVDNVISASVGGGGVTQEYVDGQDAATLNSAKTYVSSNYYDKTYTDERYGVISASLNDLDGRMVLLTQAQYDALETKNPKVLYLICED